MLLDYLLTTELFIISFGTNQNHIGRLEMNSSDKFNKMKIAVCYRGHYYRKGGAYISEQLGSNFSLCYENHKEKLFSYLDDYDVFFHTYSHTQTSDEKLVETLQPKKCIIDEEVHPKISYSIGQASSLVSDEYDFIINLRFDLLFLKPFSDFNVEYNKFNFMFRETAALVVGEKSVEKRNKLKMQ